jgi:DNA polymerase III epsilon subunit-like protein
MNQTTLPVIIDIEASGFGRNSYPIEIGLVLENGQTHCFLIKPEPEWNHWDSEGEALHGITRETLLQHGRPVKEVGNLLNELLIGKTVYSDGWSYDQTWLHTLFESIGLTPLFRIETLTRILDETQLYQWDKMKLNLIEEFGFERHRATNDAILLQKTYQAVNTRLN